MARPAHRPDRARRRTLSMLALGAGFLLVRPARATPDAQAEALRETFGARPINNGRVTLKLPALAENGFVVPVTVQVDSPMTHRDHVTAIHLFAEKNPLPRVLEVQL
ncbi:MAG: thiosulfate oxidation carrier protein SoxY, partial [Burkholderiales bacterium]